MVRQQKDVLTFVAADDAAITRKGCPSSLARVADILREADIDLFNCERPHAEKGSPGIAQHDVLPYDSPNKPPLTVCMPANNHTSANIHEVLNKSIVVPNIKSRRGEGKI